MSKKTVSMFTAAAVATAAFATSAMANDRDAMVERIHGFQAETRAQVIDVVEKSRASGISVLTLANIQNDQRNTRKQVAELVERSQRTGLDMVTTAYLKNAMEAEDNQRQLARNPAMDGMDMSSENDG